MPGTLSPGPSASTGPSSEAVASVDWPVGHVIDAQYEVKELIGRGGMGTVYRVRHWGWNVDLAVKVPLAHLVSDRVNKERFVLEAQTWIDLGVHPNIVQCWFVRESEGLPLLFLDYLAPGSLKDWRKAGRVGPGEWELILDLMIQACSGLGYAHEHGLVHRDVKPANLLLHEDGRLCVTDFGLVKVTQLDPLAAPPPSGSGEVQLESFTDALDQRGEEESILSSLTLTATGALLGTPEYGAPEQWTQARGVGIWADIYALGGILFELCCGRRAFDDDQGRVPSSLLVGRHISKPAPDPRQFNPAVPPDLCQVILRCLEKRPERRPPSMATLREALQRVYRDVVGRPYPRPVPQAGAQRADALNNKAVSLWNLGFNQRAFDAWREASSLDALHPETVYNRSILQWRQGQIDEGEVLRRLTQVKSAYPPLGAYLGYFHLDRFCPREAAEELKEALAYPTAARDGSVWRALGDARMYLEQFSQARNAYEQALERMPDDREARTRLEMARKETRSHRHRIRFPLAAGRLSVTRASAISAVAITLDGRSALSAEENRLELWDLASGERRWVWRVDNPDRGKYAFSRLGLTSDYVLSLDTPKGRLWSLENGQVIAELDGRQRFFAYQGGEGALAGSDDLHWVSLPDLKIKRTFVGHLKPIYCAALSQDGRLAISGSADRTVRIWDVATGQCLWTLEGHTDLIETVALSPDGAFAVSGGRDRTVRVWLLSTGDCLSVLEHAEEVRRLRLTADGRYVAVSSWGGAQKDSLDVWDLATGVRLFTRSGGGSVSLLKGGPWVLVGSRSARPGLLQLWEIPSGRLLRTFTGHLAEISALAVSKEDRWAVSGSSDGSLTVWELDWVSRVFEPSLVVNRTYDHSEVESTQRLFGKHLEDALKDYEAGDFGQAYMELIEARHIPGYIRDPRALSLNANLLPRLLRKSVRAVWQLRSCSAGPGAGGGGLVGVAITQDGAYAVSAAGKVLHLWELSSGSCMRGFTGHSEPVCALSLTADGRQAVSGSSNGNLRVWDLGSGDCIRSLSSGKEAVHALAVARGRLLVTTTSELQVWDLATGARVRTLNLDVPISCSAISADARFALSASETSGMRVWELTRGALVRGENGFSGKGLPTEGLRATAVVLSADGRYALAASLDRALRLWDLHYGTCLATWEGHIQRVSALVLTSDARIAVSAGDDGVRVWDVLTGTCLESPGQDAGPVKSVDMTPDGRFVLAAGADQTLRLWELDWQLDPEIPASTLTEAGSKAGLLGRLTSLFRRLR